MRNRWEIDELIRSLNFKNKFKNKFINPLIKPKMYQK